MSEQLKAAMDGLEARFTDWAKARDDVRAAVVVGSRARADHPADEWADLDVGIATTKPSLYHHDTAWMSEIAPVWTVYREPGGATYHVLFEGGLDAGIAVLPARVFALASRFAPALRSGFVRALPGIGRTISRELENGAEYYRPGYRILFDKDGTAGRFLTAFPGKARARRPPTAKDFAAATHEFWFNAVWTAKHLERGELWFARTAGCEGSMRQRLLEMIEWHALAEHGAGYETWERGRFMEEWAAPRVIDDLNAIVTGYDKASVRLALRATMALYRWLSAEIAERLGYTPSDGLAANVTAWVEANTAE